MNDLVNFFPRTFFEVAGGVFCIAALIFSVISLFEKVRTHSLRVLAIFVVAALSLFGNHISVYFAAVFIIATAVTELEFLQTLAAIIRGNKEYFTYKTGTVSDKEKLRLLKAELDELGVGEKIPVKAANEELDLPPMQPDESSPTAGAAKSVDYGVIVDSDASSQGSSIAEPKAAYTVPSPVSPQNTVEESREDTVPPTDAAKNEVLHKALIRSRPTVATSKFLRRIMLAESKALDFVQEAYNVPIQRDVLLKSPGLSVSLDGLIKQPENSSQPDEIFEVVYLYKRNMSRLVETIYKLPSKIVSYTSITKKLATCRLVIIIGNDDGLSRREIDELDHAAKVTGLNGYHIFSEAELE